MAFSMCPVPIEPTDPWSCSLRKRIVSDQPDSLLVYQFLERASDVSLASLLTHCVGKNDLELLILPIPPAEVIVVCHYSIPGPPAC